MKKISEKMIKNNSNVKQEQIHDLLFNRDLGWQEIIYDLINTEQLDPWNIDLIFLTNKYIEKIQELEEDNYFVSSKVLFAASLLLRIKSEILLNKYIKSIDEILFGKKDESSLLHQLERIELEEDIPELIPRSPIPRFKKVTLKELIDSLGKVIITENRRIRKEIINKNAFREMSFSLPKKRFSMKNKIREIYEQLLSHLNENEKKISFTEFIAKNSIKKQNNQKNKKEEKIISFYSLLHLENQKKIWLEQKKPFDEIYVWTQKAFFKNNNPFSDLQNSD